MAETKRRETGRARKERFGSLPERIPLAETIEVVDTEPAPDPRMGRDTETEFMLRNAGA